MKTGTVIDLFPGGVFGAAFALAALLAGIGCFVQTQRIETRDAQIATLEAEARNWAKAQETNLDTIDLLQSKLAFTVNQFRVDRAAAAKASQRATDAIILIGERNTRLQTELNNVYARIPSARAWGATPVDPAVAGLLPGGANRGDAHGRGAGAGVQGARPEADRAGTRARATAQ